MRKKHCYAWILFLSCLLLSCTSTPAYTNEKTVEELALEACDELEEITFLKADGSHLSDYVDLSDFPDGTVRFAADGNDLSEFGIWHVPSDRVEELCLLLRRYLDDSLSRNRSFYDSYIPHETPKLRDAEVRVFGSYVAYAILSPEDRASFFHELDADLR